MDGETEKINHWRRHECGWMERHVWKHSGVLLRVPIGQDIVVIGNGLVVVLGQGGPAQSPRVSKLLLDGALCKRCKVCPSFSPRCDSSSELRYHFSLITIFINE